MTTETNFRDTDLEKGPTRPSFEEAVDITSHDRSPPSVTRLVHSVSVDGEYVHLGDCIYRKSELANAFAGELNPGIHQKRPSNLANPVPLGLASFSYCCLVLSLLNAQVRGVTNAKVIISASLFFGGCIELFAGLLCYPIGNTYAMTVFGSFGGFWISYGCILTDQFGIVSSYEDDPQMLANALGFFLTGWTVFTFLMLMCTLKSTWGLFLLLFFLDLTFLMLTIGTFIGNENVSIAGGYFGILSSMCGFYSLYSGVADPTNSYFPVRSYFMPNAPTV
ncbi:LADA_0B04038g1_1 [Lachancea dasiensis]|uniref:LADA_0B04038g1_1 n=1 Tax=Lachancea dasiensis TaxID=1072105 RepID=A0A1G4ISW0_9SACH|nr:LADA_0B04038g1_1 [Lachancea dasiensis]